jgi:hypothetical protein
VNRSEEEEEEEEEEDADVEKRLTLLTGSINISS